MRHYIGNVNEFENGKPLIVEINGKSIGIIKSNNQFYAIRNICPHKQAPLCKGTVRGTMLPSEPCEFVFGLEGQVLQCPWHGWEFDLKTGEALFGISDKRVATYPIEIKDEKIYVEVK